MKKTHNPQLTKLSQTLRKNMTTEEKTLWYKYLHNYPIKFYRQRVINNYIVDFYCSKAKLIIELDGSQHYEVNGLIKDNKRTSELESLGYKVVRIPNNMINTNLSGVCDYIDKLVDKSINRIDE